MIPFKDDNPIRTFPFVTIGIILLNVFVFFRQLMAEPGGETFVYSYGAIPYNIINHKSDQPISPVLTIFSAMFMHGGFLHLAGNMLYFWIFGHSIEERLGRIRFLFFYLFCGVIAAYSHAMISPQSNIPMIGASGAVSGILGAYFLLFPAARIHTLVFLGFFIQVIRIPALIVIGFWAIIQVVNGLIAQNALSHGGIAWFAHVGGFVAGLITIKLWLPRRSKTWL